MAEKGFVAIDGNVISQVGTGEPSAQLMAEATELVDVAGDYILPGAIDDQVHFREPGLTHKADIESEKKPMNSSFPARISSMV